MVYPEGIFLWWGLFIPGFKTIAYVVDKQIYIWRRYLLLQGLCVPSVKTTTYVCNRFNTSFCARDHKTNQAISNLNRKFWNKSTQQIKSTTFLTDLCFIKKFKYFKVSLCWYLCVICYNSNWIWCFIKRNFLPYITKVVILRV